MRMFFQSLPSEQPEPPTFDIYYTRPAGSTYGNGNGGSYENAFSGFSLIPWSNLQNKQLIINGNHLETLNVGASNLTIKGDDVNENGTVTDIQFYDYFNVTVQNLGTKKQNLIKYSNNISNSNFTKDSLDVITENGYNILKGNSINNQNKRIFQSLSLTSATYTVQFKCRFISQKNIQFISGGGSNSEFCNFDIENGIIGTKGNGVGSISLLDDGYFLCSYVYTDNSNALVIQLVDGNNASRGATSTTLNSLQIKDIQVNEGVSKLYYSETSSLPLTNQVSYNLNFIYKQVFTAISQGITANYGNQYSEINTALTYISQFTDSENGGVVLLFDSGVYQTDTAILIPSKIEIRGKGIDTTTIQTTTDNAQLGLYKGILYTESENVKFTELTVDGRFSNNLPYSAGSDSSMMNRSSGIEFLLQSSNGIVKNVKCTNNTRHGLLLLGRGHFINSYTGFNSNSFNLSTGGLSNQAGGQPTMRGCYSKNLTLERSTAKRNIEVNDGSHFLTIDTFTTNGQGRHDPIFVHDHGNLNEENENVLIKNGVISQTKGSGPALLVFGSNSLIQKNIVFEDINIIDHDHNAGRAGQFTDGVVFRRITGNCSRGFTTVATSGGIARNFIIENCNISSYSDDNQDVYYIKDSIGGKIINNTINGWNKGVYIENSDNIEFDGNQIDNIATSPSGSAILLVGSGANLIINNNNVKDTSQSMNYSLFNSNGYSNAFFTNNSFAEHQISAFGGDAISATQTSTNNIIN